MFKKVLFILSILFAPVLLIQAATASAYNFGDFKSSTLVGKAWNALNQNDTEGVMAYTNKCLELYTAQAKKMQAGLTDFAKGTNDEIHAYWALTMWPPPCSFRGRPMPRPARMMRPRPLMNG